MTPRRRTAVEQAAADKAKDAPEPTEAEPDPKPAPRRAVAELRATPFRARLAQAMSEVSAIAKTGENRDQGYKFATAEAIMQAVRGPLFAHGIVLHVTTVKLDREVITSQRGSKGEKITAEVLFTFMDGYSDDTSASTWYGVGEDYGDKAIGKAYTNAIKTFARAAFLLPTDIDDDPERDAPKVPDWQVPVSDDLRRKAIAGMSDLIGRENARKVLANVDRYHGRDGTARGAAYALGELVQAWKAWVEAQQEERDAAIAAQEAATEPEPTDVRRTAPEVPGGIEAESAHLDPSEPEPQPDPEPADDPDDDSPVFPPGTVPDPGGDGMKPEEYLRRLRTLGCNCPMPNASDPERVRRRDDCPIVGHGTPVM